MKKPALKFLFVLTLVLTVGAVVLFVALKLRTPKAVDCDLSELGNALQAEGLTENMVPGTPLELKKRFGLLEADQVSVLHFAPVTYMNVEEILVVEVQSRDEGERVENAVRTEWETLKKLFENYGIDQFGYLTGASIYRNDRYVVYAAGPRSEEALRLIRSRTER